MKITHCKLKKKVQKELLRFFVLEVTARSAADILDIHPNSAALFYRKIRTVINYHLALAADEVFEGNISTNLVQPQNETHPTDGSCRYDDCSQ